MCCATRVRILSQGVCASLTRAQAVMACDLAALYSAAATLAAGQPLNGAQAAATNSAWQVLRYGQPAAARSGTDPPGGMLTAESAAILADSAAVRQRDLLASTVVNTLKLANWTVTVVDGGAPDRYTGIEATRASEHLIVAVGPGEFIADQAGARDCGATVDALTEGLREIGFALQVSDDVPRDGFGGSLFALGGGPSRAHAVQAALRNESSRPGPARRRAAPPAIRLIAG